MVCKSGKWICFCLLLCIMLLTVPVSAVFSESHTNETTGYEMVINDEAGILDPDSTELVSVWEQLETISQYGNAMLLTVSENGESTSDLAEEAYHNTYGQASGVLCLIDMDNREIYIFSDGEIYDTITPTTALIITDNSYEYATDGQYAQCLLEMTGEIAAKLEGSTIAQPMRYLCALFLAILVGLLLTFILAKKMNSTALSAEGDIFNSISVKQELKDARVLLVDRKISMESESSSGSGGGGGGSSGGGGGHGF